MYDGGERLAAPCHARRLPSLPSSLLFRHTLRSLPRHENSLSLFLSIIIVLPSLHTDLLLLHTLRSSSKHQSSLSFFLSMMIVLSTDTLVCSPSCIPRRSPAVACSHPILQCNPLSFVASNNNSWHDGNLSILWKHALACSLAFFFGGCMFAADYAS